MIFPFVRDEFSQLQDVVLGISNDFGGCPNLKDAYDPKSKEHIMRNTFPREKDIQMELDGFLSVLEKYHVNVLRPNNLFQCNQVFARDVGFVIDGQFFISNMIKNRSQEILGFDIILKQINSTHINHLPKDVFVEGGDVVLLGDFIFVGYSKKTDFHQFQVSRTNGKFLDFLSTKFPSKKIIGFELNKSDDISIQNCLHLDCCFQPLGLGHVLLHADGFKYQKDLQLIYDMFGEENIILINKQEMSNMYANLFSISHNIIVSEKKFSRINQLLIKKGYIVEEIPFSETAKMGGLLRCVTLPLIRTNEP